MSLTESERRSAITAGAKHSAIRAAIASAHLGHRAIVVVDDVRTAHRTAKNYWPPKFVNRVTHANNRGLIQFVSGGSVTFLTRRTLDTEIRGLQVDIILEDEL